MRIASLQMVSTPLLAENLKQAEALLREAAAAGAELAVLPEYFCIMGHRDGDKLTIQEPYGLGPASPIQTQMSAWAKELGLYLVAGTIPLTTATPERVRNSSLVFAPSGECIARYDKIHLFSFHKGREAYNEAKTLEPGDSLVYFELPSRDGQTWRIGMSICYDLRFAELYQALAADLILVPAAFTHTTGQAHWEILLRARAIENQAYVLASAQGGLHENGRSTWGHSMVVNPWGEIMQEYAEGVGCVIADIDKAQLQHVRTQLPALQHRVLVSAAPTKLASNGLPATPIRG